MNHHVRRSVVAVGLVGALALAGCQSATDASPSESAAETEEESVAASASASSAPSESATSGGEETSVFDLEVGDCFGATTADQVDSVVVVDCEETHIYEVFALVDHEAGGDEAYPGDDAIGQYAADVCSGPFTDYVDHDYETSVYWITTVTPSAETWADGDREIVCTLKLGEEAQETTGSAEGSAE